MRRARKKAPVRNKQHRLSLWVPSGDLAVIDRAARLCGCSRADFVREMAVQAAEDVVLEHGLIRMSPKGFGAFTTAFAAPGKPAPAMVKVLKHPAPWDKGTNR